MHRNTSGAAYRNEKGTKAKSERESQPYGKQTQSTAESTHVLLKRENGRKTVKRSREIRKGVKHAPETVRWTFLRPLGIGQHFSNKHGAHPRRQNNPKTLGKRTRLETMTQTNVCQRKWSQFG